MPKAGPADYTVTTDGDYMLRRISGESLKYRKYQYKQLSSKRSIRLITRIRAHPGDNSFDHFSIEEHSLDDPNLKYIAISYVWGDAQATAPLIIGNEVDSSVRLITKTAWEAIETLCMFDHLFWIDQICINQEDVDEVNAQVELMGEIYSSQRRWVTTVWLGAADEETKTAFDLVAKLSEVMPLDMTIPINVSDAFHMPHDMIRQKIQAEYPKYEPPADHDASWASLAKILARTWYSRMWTFQEAVLTDLDSVCVVCANKNSRYSTDLRRIMRASILLGSYSIPGYNDAIVENRTSLYLINATQQRLRNNQSTPLHYLLQVTASRDCRDPKDKIYALLNVQCNDLAMDKIKVDKSKSHAEVYADTTRRIIASELSLLVSLSASGRHEGKVKQLPSWVPDYSGTILAPYLEVLDPNPPLFSASGGRSWRVSSTQSGSQSSWQRLLVQGRRIDTVSKVDEHVMPAKAGGDDIYAYLCQVLPTILLQLKGPSGENEINKTMLRIAKTVIVGGYHTYLFGSRPFSFIVKATSACYGASATISNARKHEEEDLMMLRPIFGEPSPPSSHTPDSANEVERQWNHDFVKQASLCKGRRFAFLKDRGIGLVPHQTKEGDIVTILHGSSLPVILRPAQVDDTFYLIGPCFVDGIMLGEAVDWAEDDGDRFVLV